MPRSSKRNGNSKNHYGKNQEKSESKSRPQDSALFSDQPITAPLAYSTNTAANYVSLAVTNFALGINETNLSFGLVGDSIEAIINAISAQRGYETATTQANIQDYIVAAAQMYSIYLTIRRLSNTKKLRDNLGHTVGEIFQHVPYTGLKGIEPDGFSTGIYTTDGEDATGTINILDGTGMVEASNGISSYSWENIYVSEVRQLRLPAGVKKLVELIFMGYISNPFSVCESYIQFFPKSQVINTTSVTSLSAAFETARAAVATELGTAGDFLEMLKELGFVSLAGAYP